MSMSVEGVARCRPARASARRTRSSSAASRRRPARPIADAGAVMVITADSSCAAAKQLPLKAIVDEALALDGCDSVKDVVVYQRTGGKIAWNAPRDKWMHEVGRPADTCEPGGSAPGASAVPALHLGFDRQAQGRAALHRRLPAARGADDQVDLRPQAGRRLPGAPPTSAGSPATPTSPTARWRTAAPRSCSRACPPTRTPAASGR